MQTKRKTSSFSVKGKRCKKRKHSNKERGKKLNYRNKD